jgi:hypothetical protein
MARSMALAEIRANRKLGKAVKLTGNAQTVDVGDCRPWACGRPSGMLGLVNGVTGMCV